MKIVILGSIPGGYTCAIRCVQLGADVTLIEKDRICGVCLNEGCIPTKTLLSSSHSYCSDIQFKSLGIEAHMTFDWNKIKAIRILFMKGLVREWNSCNSL